MAKQPYALGGLFSSTLKKRKEIHHDSVRTFMRPAKSKIDYRKMFDIFFLGLTFFKPEVAYVSVYRVIQPMPLEMLVGEGEDFWTVPAIFEF